jgi:DNA-binding transcriptional LysR family regulator
LLADAEQLELEIRGTARDPVGRVTIGSLPSITNPIVGQLFERLRSRYPGIQLKFLEGSSGQVDEWLADARIDIAILYRYGANLSEHEQLLATVDSYLIGAAGDKVTAYEEIPFASLDALPFALPGAPNGLRTTLDSIAQQQHICLEPAIEADSLPLMRSLVAEARLYTVLPIHAVWNEVRDGRLQASKIIDPGIQRKVTMALTRSKGPSKAVKTVAAEIVKIVEEKGRDGMWSAELKTDPLS